MFAKLTAIVLKVNYGISMAQVEINRPHNIPNRINVQYTWSEDMIKGFDLKGDGKKKRIRKLWLCFNTVMQKERKKKTENKKLNSHCLFEVFVPMQCVFTKDSVCKSPFHA